MSFTPDSGQLTAIGKLLNQLLDAVEGFGEALVSARSAVRFEGRSAWFAGFSLAGLKSLLDDLDSFVELRFEVLNEAFEPLAKIDIGIQPSDDRISE